MTHGYKPKNQVSTVITHTAPNSWELQDRDVERLTKEFMESYRFSSLYLESCREHWDWHLWSYVYHVATIQAQMITGAKVGYSSVTLGMSDKAEISRFLDEQRGLCAFGGIDVRVPTKLINEWKKSCTKSIAHPSSHTRTAKITS